MIPAVDVIVDRNDDITTVRAIHRLAADHPDVLAISIAPASRTATAVIWAILRALGKRTDKLCSHTPRRSDAEAWLRAHRIAELVVLRRGQSARRSVETAAAQREVHVCRPSL